jgi:hypothetical protein
MLRLFPKTETVGNLYYSAFLRTGIVLPKPVKKAIEKGHSEEWPMILPQVIHHERAVK